MNSTDREDLTTPAPHDAPFAGCGVFMRQKHLRESSMTDLAPDARTDSLSPGQALHHGMIFVPGGTFRMGSDNHYAEEAPAHRVTVGGFWIDRTPITNRDF